MHELLKMAEKNMFDSFGLNKYIFLFKKKKALYGGGGWKLHPPVRWSCNKNLMHYLLVLYEVIMHLRLPHKD